MSPEEKTRLENKISLLEREVYALRNTVNYGSFQDKKVFDKTALFNNGVKFPNNAFIYGGSATGDTDI